MCTLRKLPLCFFMYRFYFAKKKKKTVISNNQTRIFFSSHTTGLQSLLKSNKKKKKWTQYVITCQQSRLAKCFNKVGMSSHVQKSQRHGTPVPDGLNESWREPCGEAAGMSRCGAKGGETNTHRYTRRPSWKSTAAQSEGLPSGRSQSFRGKLANGVSAVV